jgi:aspartate kinase
VRQGCGNALDQVEQLRIRHNKIADDLFTSDLLFTVQSEINAMMDELRDITKSIIILCELTGRSLDTFAPIGERLSTLLLFHQFVINGVDSVLINAQEIIVTNDDFTRVAPRFDEIPKRAEMILGPHVEAGQVVVTQGFLGATPDVIPTTIGRGGLGLFCGNHRRGDGCRGGPDLDRRRWHHDMRPEGRSGCDTH